MHIIRLQIFKAILALQYHKDVLNDVSQNIIKDSFTISLYHSTKIALKIWAWSALKLKIGLGLERYG